MANNLQLVLINYQIIGRNDIFPLTSPDGVNVVPTLQVRTDAVPVRDTHGAEVPQLRAGANVSVWMYAQDSTWQFAPSGVVGSC